jgi:phosphoglycerate dehydrogenase-like enzyme
VPAPKRPQPVSSINSRLRVVVATPLEADQVERIRGVAPDRVEVLYEPTLLPPTRYRADHKGQSDFRRGADAEARWRTLIGMADVLFDIPPDGPDGHNPVVLAEQLRWVQTTNSGVGPLVARLGLIERGVMVTTARGIHAEPLTEFVFLALLMHVKNLAYLRQEQAAHRWERYCGGGLSGMTLSIVGMGEVGRHVARLARAFGMRTLGLVRDGGEANASTLGVDAVHHRASLHGMLAQSDALVLCAPHTPQTEGMIDTAALGALRPGAVLVNIGRGQLVDEPALIDALRTRHLGFAALDVAAVEPLPADSPLWDLENVLVSPHSASTVATENARITDIFCHNLGCYLDGKVERMRNPFSPDRGY